MLSNLVSSSGELSLWDRPELLDFLSNHPARGELFFLEHTTAAKGPWILWYPMAAWEEEQKRQADIDQCVTRQYAAIEQAKAYRYACIIVSINTAKKRGDLDAIVELRKELNKL